MRKSVVSITKFNKLVIFKKMLDQVINDLVQFKQILNSSYLIDSLVILNCTIRIEFFLVRKKFWISNKKKKKNDTVQERKLLIKINTVAEWDRARHMDMVQVVGEWGLISSGCWLEMFKCRIWQVE